ncbi:MgtC/SapB family protein, partial [Oceanivirga salmonicida]|uniref:MgtC/SapB family protein n=1 Tax=Oceanivirga salmonicida TaxID=1769291 RepID=UPI000A6F1752
MSSTNSFIIRILISAFLGVLIGYERTNKNKDAGIRTHAIVAISSCLMMIISKYGFEDVGHYDASRVASQIITGIGFLGAGVIFVKNNNVVSGLTTSAGIWATAGVGMSVGAGLIKLGIFVSILLLFLQIYTHFIQLL